MWNFLLFVLQEYIVSWDFKGPKNPRNATWDPQEIAGLFLGIII